MHMLLTGPGSTFGAILQVEGPEPAAGALREAVSWPIAGRVGEDVGPINFLFKAAEMILSPHHDAFWRSDRHVAGMSIPFSTHLMNPLATWPVTSIRCSRIASEAPKPPRSLSVHSVVRCARVRKPSATRIDRR